MLKFEEMFEKEKVILMEGALVERLRREYRIEADKEIAIAGHIYSEIKRKALSELFEQYFNIANKYGLPMIVTTPTRRANKERIYCSDFKENNVIEDNVKFLKDLRGRTKAKVYVGGLMGCRGDAYSDDNHLNIENAFKFHLWQSELFKKAKVDFLYAGIMPVLSEAIGIAKAMEASGLPYIISFMIRKDGRLLDGTTINDAIIAIDENTERNPICYMTNCVHPKILKSALLKEYNNTYVVSARFKGIQANASELSPEELDGSDVLKTSDNISLANDMVSLYNEFDLEIFGGCCGTDNTHIEEIAKRLKNILEE